MKDYLTILNLSVTIFLQDSVAFAHTALSDNVSHYHGLTVAFVSSTYFIGFILICAISAATLVHYNINKKRV